MYVDNAAMQLVRAPKQFDVMVTGNMFGDIVGLCGDANVDWHVASASLDANGRACTSRCMAVRQTLPARIANGRRLCCQSL